MKVQVPRFASKRRPLLYALNGSEMCIRVDIFSPVIVSRLQCGDNVVLALDSKKL